MSDQADKVAIALDTSDWDEFSLWCRVFGPHVGLLKVGLEAFLRWGPAAVDEARAQGRVFLDLKLHDIPNTVAGAVRAVGDMGVDYVTVHAGGGAEMLRAAAEAGGSRVQTLAVTLLTHIDASSLADLALEGPSERLVLTWGKLAAVSGCSGAVCSPREVALLRGVLPREFVLVTPGIRPSGAELNDQRRTATPAAALGAGADVLVVGRPLTRAKDPLQALERLLTEIQVGKGPTR